MMFLKKDVFIVLAVLTFTTLTTSNGYAQWGDLFRGIVSAVGEQYINNSSSLPTSQDKDNARMILNSLTNESNSNQNARNATKDVYEGNYTGAIIQGTQAILNTTGNHSYDTYLNSANQINNANREYKQDLINGMDRNEALDKRNTTIGYSAAESAIELQDKIAQERAEKARQQRELEQQSRKDDNYYPEPSYSETGKETRTTPSGLNEEVSYYPSKTSNDFNEYNSYNSNAQTLSSVNSVKFLTEEGEDIWLHILYHGLDEGSYLSFTNHSDKAKRLSCNKVLVKVKYVGDVNEHTFTETCSFTLPAHTDGYLEWSDIFPNLFERLSDAHIIESINVCFIETQIKSEACLAETQINKSNDYSENRTFNSNVHILTKDNYIKFLTDEGVPVFLGIEQTSESDFDDDFIPDWNKIFELIEQSTIIDKDLIVSVIKNSNDREQEIQNLLNLYPELESLLSLIHSKVVERSMLFYNNSYCDKELRLICNRVSIKVKYVGEENEERFTDACSFIIPPLTYGELEWSDVFFNISETREIESIKVQFIDTQIK